MEDVPTAAWYAALRLSLSISSGAYSAILIARGRMLYRGRVWALYVDVRAMSKGVIGLQGGWRIPGWWMASILPRWRGLAK